MKRIFWAFSVLFNGVAFCFSGNMVQAETYEADVVIVGGGTAGMAAALAAAEGGAEVLILERTKISGGAGNLAGGIFAVESRVQVDQGVELTKEKAFEDLMENNHWRPDARLMKAFVDHSGDMIAWLEDMGVEFWGAFPFEPRSYATWHSPKKKGAPGPVVGSGVVAMAAIAKQAEKLGVEILFETKGRELIEQDGQVIGVMAQDKSGETIRAEAKALIITTGGFLGNKEMMAEILGFEKDCCGWWDQAAPFEQGDGIRMAWAIGAGGRETISHEFGTRIPGVVVESAAFSQPSLMVDLNGVRFFNEERISDYSGPAISTLKEETAFVILDERLRKLYEERGLDFRLDEEPLKLRGLDRVMRKGIEAGSMYKADSIKELAEKMGVDLNALRKTVVEYNMFCEAGEDPLFYKDAGFLRAIKEPPFYAAKLTTCLNFLMGGIKINHKTEVLDERGEVIPGLYAAGTVANSLNPVSYDWRYPGAAFAFALISGRMAGENACQ